jgi:hypothetical protein
MSLDPQAMLEKCRRGQWSVDDFDWSGRPVPLSKEKELQVCSYYVNMSYIERVAGALFLSLSKRLDDPTLAAIFETFFADELRHSHAAARLADYFDVHHYRVYTPNVPMLRFIPPFVSAIDTLHPAFATSFILGGELILDVALLRGLNAYVDDPLSRAVVERINQDESRHLAMDRYMTTYFARRLVPEAVRGADNVWVSRDFWGILTWAPGFFAEVFFRPMQLLDPTQKEMRDVARRLRRFYLRPENAGNPAVREFNRVAALLETRLGALVGTSLEAVIRRVSGVDLGFLRAAAST